MAWTAPLTAVTGNVFTAAQFNASIRDNLLETMPGKATAAGHLFAVTGTNAIAERIPQMGSVATRESRTNVAYGDLTTPGPAVTVTSGTRVFILMETQLSTTSITSGSAVATWECSGATTLAANDKYAIMQEGVGDASREMRYGVQHVVTGLTAGSNTFTMKYKAATNGTASFEQRKITVIPF